MTQDCAELPRAVSIAPLRGGERLRGGKPRGRGGCKPHAKAHTPCVGKCRSLSHKRCIGRASMCTATPSTAAPKATEEECGGKVESQPRSPATLAGGDASTASAASATKTRTPRPSGCQAIAKVAVLPPAMNTVACGRARGRHACESRTAGAELQQTRAAEPRGLSGTEARTTAPEGARRSTKGADPVRSSSAADAASVSSAALGASSRLSSAAGAAWPFAAEPARRRRAAGGGDSP